MDGGWCDRGCQPSPDVIRRVFATTWHDALDSSPRRRRLGMDSRVQHSIDVLRTTGWRSVPMFRSDLLLLSGASIPAILQRALRHCFWTVPSD